MAKKEQTYDFICFTDLVYEFDSSKKKEVEKKIKRRLKYYNLGDYNQDRVDYIRDIKSDLYSEISSREKSKFYKKSDSIYAELNDFNIDEMTNFYFSKYRKINKDELKAMVYFAIYLFHMR